MIDIHSHIIHGVDDGPTSLEEAARMVYAAEEAGVKVIIATPHLREPYADIEVVEQHFRELVEKTEDSGVILLLGYEIFFNVLVMEELIKTSRYTLGTSRYVLIEFPFTSIPPYSREILHRLHLHGFHTILAHPERNSSVIGNIDWLKDFMDMGCQIQVDAESIIGIFGSRTKAYARQLVRQGKVDYIASDAHKVVVYSVRYMKAYRQVVRWLGQWKADSLFCSNAKVIVDSAISKSAYIRM
jgi:protein-tyrosine phosphatase